MVDSMFYLFSVAVVPNFFVAGTSVMENNFSMDWSGGRGDFKMILIRCEQSRFLTCAVHSRVHRPMRI